MGKRTKRTNPLGPRASRVEKTHKPTSKLPSWYDRVYRLRWDHGPFDDEDSREFDEDLSELEEESQQQAGKCECGGEDLECDCQDEDLSYDGSDADYYYRMKEQREERKREKLQEEKEKDQHLESENSKEDEVRAAYKSLREAGKQRKTIPIKPLAGQRFKLFCSNHVNYFHGNDLCVPKLLCFLQSDDFGPGPDNPDFKWPKSGQKTDLYGHLTLDADVTYDFGPIRPRTHASRKPVKVKTIDGKYELSFQFIGDGYLKLRVSREMVFIGYRGTYPGGIPATAPAVFDFVGILRDPEKEKAEQDKIEEERRLRRSRSPRESWFEMNHPMGAWRWLRL